MIEAEISMKRAYIPSLDLLRGVAALSVCFFHLLGKCTFEPWTFIHSVVSSMALGLDLFFFISGFIIPYSMYHNGYSIASFHRFLLRRSCRIELPYIASFVLVILIRMIHSNRYGDMYTPDLEQVLLHLVYLNQYFGWEPFIVVYWTLVIEFQFYLLIGLLYGAIVNPDRWKPLLILGIWFLATWYIQLPYNWGIFQYGFHFSAGIALFLYKVGRLSTGRFILLFLANLLLMAARGQEWAALVLLVASFIILRLHRSWKLTDLLGRISFSLYLTHTEAGGWFELYAREFKWIENEILLRLMTLVFAIGFATVFYYAVERPAWALAKRIPLRSKGANHRRPENLGAG